MSVNVEISAALAGSAAASAAVPDPPGDEASLAWRWVVRPDALELYAADPDGPDWRATCLGAGGALHRARVALAAEGLGSAVTLLPGPVPEPRVAVRRGEPRSEPRVGSRRGELPEPRSAGRRGEPRTEPRPLARLVTTGRIEVTPRARALFEALEATATGRAPSSRAAWRAVARELVAAVRAEGVRLRLVQVGGELAGVPHGGDTRESWLRAGAALSAVRLAARCHGLETVATSVAEQRRPRRGRRLVGDREGWLSVGVGTPYARLRLRPAASAPA